MADNLVKIVSIIETNVNNEETELAEAAEAEEREQATRARRVGTRRVRTMDLPPVQVDEVFFAGPTFSQRFLRYLMVVIYLCGLCSLGFVLSIYHLFFWDSRMPPLHKSMIMKKPAYMKP